MWPFSARSSPETSSDSLTTSQDDLRARLTELRMEFSAVQTTLAEIASQHRQDHLEMLDMHERVKTSLAKLNRRHRQASEPDDVEVPEEVPKPQRRVSLLSQRGRG